MDEGYYGWTNYETWGAFTWLTSYEDLYSDVMEIVNYYRGDEPEIERSLKEYVENLRDYAYSPEGSERLKLMFEDVGSLWRINWQELANAFIEE